MNEDSNMEIQNSENVLKGVIKELVLEYRENPDPALFEKILYKVDNLVLKVVNVSRTVCPHLLNEDIDDIYEAAIIGLYNALRTVKKEESSGITYARLIAYMRCSIKKEFPQKSLPDLYLSSQIKSQMGRPVEHLELEFEFISEILQDLVAKEVIAQQDLDLVLDRYLQGADCKDLAIKYQCSVSKIRKQLKDILQIVRHQLRMRGIEGF